MNKLSYKIGAGIVGGVLLTASFVGAASADVTINISRNGSGSDNDVTVKRENKIDVKQSNDVNVEIGVNVVSNTGGNKANGNTGGGDVTIDTGDATSTLKIRVDGGTNVATLPENCLCDEDVTVDVSRNGRKSDNKAKVDLKDKTKADQKNKLTVKAKDLKVKAKTGKNKSNNNTGKGAVDVSTGDSDAAVDIKVNGSSNTL